MTLEIQCLFYAMKHTIIHFCLGVIHGLEHGLSRACFVRNVIGTPDKSWGNSYFKQSRVKNTIIVNLFI